MTFPPPEPDPATAVTCPCCGEPISPEGIEFLAEQAESPMEAIRISSVLVHEEMIRDYENALIYGPRMKPAPDYRGVAGAM